nr:MFS transporter [Cellulomonas sp. APG4]
MLLIATTYGMARFGVGLLAPVLVAERPGLAGAIGIAAAGQYVSYGVAAATAAGWVDRNPRLGVLLAGGTATTGCLGIAAAQDGATFVGAVLVAGAGAGFASPALVRVVDGFVPSARRALTQSVVNTGTAVGVIGAGAVASVATRAGVAWVVMAACCAAAGTGAWVLAVRGRAPTGRVPGAEGPSVQGLVASLSVPVMAAVVAGVGSAFVWTFGPLLLAEGGVVAPDDSGGLWIGLGAGGLLGVLTGALVDRAGLRRGWVLTAAVLALATGGLGAALATTGVVLAHAAMAVFGAAYMALSGALILWARDVRPEAGGAGTSLLFIALGAGQAVGSALVGGLRDIVPPTALAAGAGAVCLVSAILGALPSTHGRRRVRARAPSRHPAAPA